MVPARQIHHFANLSRGLECPCPKPRMHVTRIQSTRCEQKQWAQLLHDVGPELLFVIAMGHIAIVHDLSERNRESRACWQGLSWIRYACWRTWNHTPPPIEKSHGGIVLNKYWEAQYQLLPRTTRHYLRYFKKFHKDGTSLYLRSCWTRGGGRQPAASVNGILANRNLPFVDCC